MLRRFGETCNRSGGQDLLFFAGDGRFAVVLLRAIVAEVRVVAAGNDELPHMRRHLVRGFIVFRTVEYAVIAVDD